MRSLIENIAREQLNPVDQWRAIERLVALGWTEEAIASRSPSRCARSRSCGCSPMCCRPCSTTWPRATCQRAAAAHHRGRLARRAEGGLEEAQAVQGRSAGLVVERRQGAHQDPHVCARCQLRRRSRAGLRHRLGRGPVRAGRRGQPLHHRRRGLPRRAAGVDDAEPAEAGVIAEDQRLGRAEAAAEGRARLWQAGKSDHTAMYLDREGKVQTVHFRMPEAKKKQGRKDADERGRYCVVCRSRAPT
jgi:ParB family chromosome partitioning protein